MGGLLSLFFLKSIAISAVNGNKRCDPIFKDPDHNSFSEGLYRLYFPPPAISSDSAPLLTVGTRDKRSPSRMAPNEAFIWCVLRHLHVAVPLPYPGAHNADAPPFQLVRCAQIQFGVCRCLLRSHQVN